MTYQIHINMLSTGEKLAPTFLLHGPFSMDSMLQQLSQSLTEPWIVRLRALLPKYNHEWWWKSVYSLGSSLGAG